MAYNSLDIDIFEPQEIERLLSQSVPTSRIPLNEHGCADYLWTDILGLVNQVERKTIDEILGGVDHVEEQLRREMTTADRTYLLYEGYFEQLSSQTCVTWHKKGRLMVHSREYKTSYAGIMAWFDQLDRAGITIINTCDVVGTASALVALYNNSQKEEHTTLKRYIKEKIYPPPQNPHIYNLMAIKGVELGEARAKALIERFGTFWYVVNQDAEMLAETMVGNKQLGLVLARKLLKCLGRE